MSQALSVPKTEWRAFFDRMSNSLLASGPKSKSRPSISAIKIVAEWVPMLGITYDSGDDLLDVALARANHLIRHPREVIVDEGPNGMSSVAVVDAEGTQQVIRLKEPLKLPPANVRE